MKIILQILKICCIAVLLAPVGTTAQPETLNTVSDQSSTFTINVVKRPLENVLASLGKQTGLDIHYDRNEFNSEQLVSLQCTNLPVKDVLAEITGQTGLHFSLFKNKLIVSGTVNSPTDIQKVQGTVKDSTGAPLIGVSVSIKGTTKGTQTDINGQFSLDASAGDILVFTYIGFVTKEVAVGNQTTINIVLQSNPNALHEVVVTALGLTKSEASLSYDQQTVSGKELEVAKDPSFVNSLDGKVSGLQITQSSSGAGGSTKVVLRGNKSIYGSSNVLYVVDGVPLQSLTSGQPNGVFSYAPDGGDGISNINPDDIESISVLKGASASALYGSQAANGVILITTKKGQAGKTSITLSSNTTFDKPVLLPKIQSEYGRGDHDTTNSSSLNSYGAKEAPGTPNYNPASFFNTGVSTINSFTLSTGTEKNQTYVSYANTHANGVEPNNTFSRNNISIRNTSKLFKDKLTLDLSVNYIFQNTVDRPTSGTYFNPLTSVYLFPRGTDFGPYSYKNYESYDPTRNILLPNWITPYTNSGSGGDDPQNPYWIQYRNPNNQGLNRLLANVTAKYDFTSWLNLQARVKLDKANQTSSQELYAGTTELLAGPAGGYSYTSSGTNQVYADLLLNANKDLSRDFNFNGTIGFIIQDNQNNSLGFGGHLGNIDNFFNVTNLILTNGNPFTQTNNTENQTQSALASFDFGYKKFLYLDITGRNDWASPLAFTPSYSFFYPSVGLSGVLSSMFKMPAFVSFSKLRLSYTQVGNSIPPFVSTNPYQSTLSNGFLNLNATKPLSTLKPELTNSFEAGMEWRFFNDHLTFDATYYHTNTLNQLFNVATTVASQYATQYINGGNVRNEGFEGSLGYNGNLATGLRWNTTVTFSMNRNKVLALYTDNSSGTPNVITQFTFPNSFNSYALEANVGKPFGEIYANDFLRDANGNIVVSGGLPQLVNNAQKFTDVGNTNPDFLLGWTNSFRFKQFDLAFTVDSRFGGKVVDMTNAYLDQYGVSQASATARDNGGVLVNGTLINAQTYYSVVGGRGGALTQYAYSATNIRLREASLGYTIPGSVFNNKIQNIRIAFTGRNLFFFYVKAPYDPETTLSTDNTLQGIELFGQPSTRSLGFNVTARF